MAIGKIKFFNEEKGFGFISVEGETAKVDIFVHASGFSKDIDEVAEGDQVAFDVVPGKKGWAAVNVKIL